jgi:hypothetical protein
VMNVDYDDNDARMIADWRTQAAEMLEAAGCHDIETHDKGWAPGLDIHEMGGARMGKIRGAPSSMSGTRCMAARTCSSPTAPA